MKPRYIVLFIICVLAGLSLLCLFFPQGGIRVGNHVVIGAGSVVTRDIPPRSFAAGVPCRVIRQITDKDKR